MNYEKAFYFSIGVVFIGALMLILGVWKPARFNAGVPFMGNDPAPVVREGR